MRRSNSALLIRNKAKIFLEYFNDENNCLFFIGDISGFRRRDRSEIFDLSILNIAVVKIKFSLKPISAESVLRSVRPVFAN